MLSTLRNQSKTETNENSKSFEVLAKHPPKSSRSVKKEVHPHHADSITAPVVENPIDFTKIPRFPAPESKWYEPIPSPLHMTDFNTEFRKFQWEHLNFVTKKGNETVEGPNFNRIYVIHDDRLLGNLSRMHFIDPSLLRDLSKVAFYGDGSIVCRGPPGMGMTCSFVELAILQLLEKPRLGAPAAPTVLILCNSERLVRKTMHHMRAMLGINKHRLFKPIREVRIEEIMKKKRNRGHIVIGNANKLDEWMEKHQIDLKGLKYIIFYYVDQLDGNAEFEEVSRSVMKKIPSETLERLPIGIYSSTFDFSSDSTLTDFQSDIIGMKEHTILSIPCRLPSEIVQNFVKIPSYTEGDFMSLPTFVEMRNIIDLIEKELEETGCPKEGPFKQAIMIFCETKQKVLFVNNFLMQMGYKFCPLSTGIFPRDQKTFLTDVAAGELQGVVCTRKRKVKCPAVRNVIVVGFPKTFKTYKHHVGQAGKDGLGGKMTVLVAEEDTIVEGKSRRQLKKTAIRQVVPYLKETGQEIPDWLMTWFEQDLEISEN